MPVKTLVKSLLHSDLSQKNKTINKTIWRMQTADLRQLCGH